MSGKSRLGVVLVFVLALLMASAGLALAKGLGTLIISGPGIKGQVEISGAESLGKLEQTGFFEASQIVKAPEGLGEGYKITQYLNMESGPVEWQEMVYYPGAEGENSYLYQVGPLNPDAPQVADRWSIIQPAADQAFRSLLKVHGVEVVIVPAAPAVEAGEPASGAQPAAESASASAAEPQPAVVAPAPSHKAAPIGSQPAQPDPGGMSGGLVWAIVSLAVLAGGFLLLRYLISQRGEPA